MARVLVAEDEAFTALALVDELERQGHQVQEARDGALALGLSPPSGPTSWSPT